MSCKVRLWLLVIMLFPAMNALSQVTTSSMSGTVSADGAPVPDAYVVAIHDPSGTVYNTVTNAEGRFSISGMRVGGPYKVLVTNIAYADYEEEGITLALGENYVLDVTMSDGVALDDVIISARRSRFSNAKTGASTNISNTNLTAVPTINRSVSDIAKLSPYASGMSIGGGDGRSTNFTVDGANFNNNFGLSSALPGGGNPISIDAIEEMQVVVAPFDVRQTNFIGGGINAITKSGTNTFKGTAYTYFTNQDLRGNKINGKDQGERAKESKNIYGLTLGGPIIKDKLFFFVNAEYEKQPQKVVNWRPSENGVADTDRSISRTSIEDMQTVKDFLINNYGYDPGSYDNYPADEDNLKILARIDWNINDAHKLSLRYNHTKNTSWFPTNGNSTDVFPRLNGMDRISQYSMAFSNSLYSQDNLVNSFSLDLNSKLSDKVSNQVLATYTKIEDIRGSNSSPFPMVDIMAGKNSDGSQILEPYMSFGYELFTWNNGVHNNIFTLTDNLTWSVNSHRIMAGFRVEHQMADNAYMRSGTGFYRYASLDDFLNQAAPEAFALTYGYGGEKNPASEVKFNQYGIYLQDEWNVTDNLKLTYGTRADLIHYADNLMGNNAIAALDFGGKSIDVGSWPKSSVQFSPRIGFIYDVMGDKTLKIRGGSGIFTGRLPLVFFTNMPTNSGMVQGSAALSTSYDSQGNVTGADPRLGLLAGKMITDVDEMISTLGLPENISPDQGELPREIAGVDPNFKMPQIWKSSLAVDYSIPADFPLSVTVEGTYTKSIHDVMLKNYDLNGPEGWERFSGPDDRYIYPEANDRTYNGINAYVLSNTSKGWGATGNITVHASPLDNLNLMMAYTYTQHKEITGMPGSNAASAYGNLISVNGPFLPDLERSQYVIPHKVIGSLDYRINYANDLMSTRLGVFYSGYSPQGYSYVYSNDMNGDGWNNDLIYIPKDRGDINFVSQADEDAYFNFAKQDKYLKKHKGQYASAYGARAPWVHRFDVHLEQEFKLEAGNTSNRLQLSLDILNFGNMLNSSWGVTKNNFPSNNSRILTYEGVNGNNEPTYSFNQVNGEYISRSFDYNYYYREAWQMQIGIKYLFN